MVISIGERADGTWSGLTWHLWHRPARTCRTVIAIPCWLAANLASLASPESHSHFFPTYRCGREDDQRHRLLTGPRSRLLDRLAAMTAGRAVPAGCPRLDGTRLVVDGGPRAEWRSPTCEVWLTGGDAGGRWSGPGRRGS
jgi:hypothetical protein